MLTAVFMLHLGVKWVELWWFDTGCAPLCPPVVPQLEEGTEMLPRFSSSCDSCGSPVIAKHSARQQHRGFNLIVRLLVVKLERSRMNELSVDFCKGLYHLNLQRYSCDNAPLQWGSEPFIHSFIHWRACSLFKTRLCQWSSPGFRCQVWIYCLCYGAIPSTGADSRGPRSLSSCQDDSASLH